MTRRANQRHSFIIAQSVRRPWARHGAPFGVTLGENSYPRLESHWLLKLQWLAAASVAGVLPSRRACESPQRLLHATIFPSSETVHHTSVRMRFLCAPIAHRCVGQGPPNRRAPVANSARPTMRMTIGRHCKRRPPHDLLIWGMSVSLPTFIQ